MLARLEKCPENFMESYTLRLAAISTKQCIPLCYRQNQIFPGVTHERTVKISLRYSIGSTKTQLEDWKQLLISTYLKDLCYKLE